MKAATDAYRASGMMDELFGLVRVMDSGKKRSYPKDLDSETLMTLLHEIQHAIQEIEGFNPGANKRDAGGFFNYQNTLGEIEARDTEDRKNLTEDERRAKTPATQLAKRPIINWGKVSTELPIDRPEDLKPFVMGEQLKFFQKVMPETIEVVRPLDREGYFRGSVYNPHSGFTIEVTKQSKGKTIKTEGSDPFIETVLKNTDRLLSAAILDKSVPDARGNKNVNAFHYFYAPIEIEGKIRVVNLLVKEVQDGKEGKPILKLSRVSEKAVGPDGKKLERPVLSDMQPASVGPHSISIDDLYSLINEE